MVSNIVDERGEYQEHDMLPQFFAHQAAWIHGDQTDQHMHYIQQLKK